MPIGNGNLPNAEAARDAVRDGKRVVVLKPDSIDDRDFTQGRAGALVREAISLGARGAQTLDELLKVIEVQTGARRAGLP